MKKRRFSVIVLLLLTVSQLVHCQMKYYPAAMMQTLSGDYGVSITQIGMVMSVCTVASGFSPALVLEKGHVIFHQPNEFHAFRAIGKKAPNLIVISFDCDCPYMDAFREKVLPTTESQVRLFGDLVESAKETFCLPLVNPLRVRSDAPFGAEQLFRSTLERLLIELYQSLSENPQAPASVPVSGNHEHLMEQVMIYLQERLTQKLTVADICRENMVSRSLLQQVFHEYKGCGVIECFNHMKIEAAMEMIRENRYTYSQIATMLNYSSYQYFSLQFRKYVRMSPSEYHSSAKHSLRRQ